LEALALVRIGEVEPLWLATLTSPLAEILGRPVRVDERVIDPASSRDAARAQYDTRRLLPQVRSCALHEDEAALGIGAVDFYSSIFTFVFGEAHLGGRAALVSMHRLRPEVYGLPADDALLGQRLLVECVHECGHLLGAVHCRMPGCVMRFSGVVEEIDLKTARPCDRCAPFFRPEGVSH
jgi:archaemetzincin